jgi:FAD/FMN-containing dehydrogenase
VSKIVKILHFFQVKFAVRSGGHSPNPGFSSIGKEGILVDLHKLNQVTLNNEKTVASVGPGGQWGDAISALDAQGATVIGGRIPNVGVGGLILGG